MTQLILNVEVPGGQPSFAATCSLCELASRLQLHVRAEVLGKTVIASPGMNPHDLYRKVFGARD